MKKAIPRKILLSLAVVILATLVAAPMVLAAGTATRDLPAISVAPGAQFDVGIVASGCGFAGQVRETLPAGFTYVSCDPGITVSQVGQEVRFTFMGASADFSYTVQAPATEDTYTFAGVVLDQDQTQSTVGGDTQVTVSEAGATHTLTVTVSPAGTGTVTKNPDQAEYAADGTVTLTANAAAGYQFSHWTGTNNNAINPTTVTMTTDKTVTANFEVSVTPQTFAWWLYETFIEPYM